MTIEQSNDVIDWGSVDTESEQQIAKDQSIQAIRTTANNDSSAEWGSASSELDTRIMIEKLRNEHRMRERVFDKEFSFKVLLTLCVFLFIILAYNMLAHWFFGADFDPLVSNIIAIIMPIFTFLLGMGTHSSTKE